MVEHTDDGRYIVVDGRRWRATDPAIPPERAAELRSVLMAWRRAVKTARGTPGERAARDGVNAAKVALGERGTPWWEADVRRTGGALGHRGAAAVVNGPGAFS